MDNSPEKSYNKLSLVAIGTVVLISLGWSLGAIGRGIRQLSQLKLETELNSNDLANFSFGSNTATGVFNYGGSTTWTSLRLAVDSLIQSERPNVQLRYIQPRNGPSGSSPGIKMLLEDRVDFVQSSRPLRPKEYILAQQRGIKLEQIPVAIDSTAVAVHPSLDLTGITLTRLQKIYTGEISNWRELGGADLPITPYARSINTGEAVDFVERKIFQNGEMGSNVRFLPTASQALERLANDPGGIYYGSMATILAECTVKPLSLGNSEMVAPYQPPLVSASECPQKRNKLNIEALRTARYPLTHYLYVVFRQNDGSEIGRAYANFLLTPQGQKLISEAGFIPLD